MKKILIIIPYFGPFPQFFKFWLRSAINNQNINFLIITDNDIYTKANIKVINMSFYSLKIFFQKKFDFQISLDTPYKLCDYRPAYGYIFDEFIKDYDFWGFGDLDLIYGSIRSFITDSMLEKYKIISGWGHFTLYENSEFCNNFFKTSEIGYTYYKDCFQSNNQYNFDEYLHNGISDLWKKLYPELIFDHKYFDDILIPRLAFNFISVFNPTVSKNLIFHYDNGNLFRIYTNKINIIQREPSLYIHLQKRNFMKIKTTNLNNYLIIPNQFIDYKLITLKFILSITKSNNLLRFLYNYYNKIKKNLLNSVKINKN
jgi:hypothetical protein